MQKNDRFIFLLIALAFFWLLFLSFRPAQQENSHDPLISEYNVTGFSTDFTKVVANDIASIVSINADGTIASGFVYKQDDSTYIITACHAVSDAQNISVVFDSRYSVSAKLVGFDPFTDLAVLSVEIPFDVTALKLTDAKLLKPGEFVISIGTPVSLDYASSVALGMVSKGILTVDNSITFNGSRSVYYLDVISISSDLESGYSGSPLINMNGEVAGMVTMKTDSDQIFALTANEMQRVADRLIAGQEVEKKQYGIRGTYIKEMPAYEKTNLNLDLEIISGLYVEKVRENSLAAQAMVRPGDVVAKINGIVIEDLDDYLDAAYLPAEELSFEVIRNGQSLMLGALHD
jgi:serine protease Do